MRDVFGMIVGVLIFSTAFIYFDNTVWEAPVVIVGGALIFFACLFQFIKHRPKIKAIVLAILEGLFS